MPNVSRMLRVNLLVVVATCAAETRLLGADGTESLLPSGFLAEGPVPIKIRVAGEKTLAAEHDEKAQLLLLTETRTVYLDFANRVEKKRAGEILSVQFLTAKHRWIFDKDKRIFTGPKLAQLPINITPIARTAREEDQYLWSTLKRLYDSAHSVLRGIGRIESENLNVQLWKKKAEGAAAYLAAASRNTELMSAFRDFATHLDQQSALCLKRRSVLAEYKKQQAEIERQMAGRERQLQAG